VQSDILTSEFLIPQQLHVPFLFLIILLIVLVLIHSFVFGRKESANEMQVARNSQYHQTTVIFF